MNRKPPIIVTPNEAEYQFNNLICNFSIKRLRLKIYFLHFNDSNAGKFVGKTYYTVIDINTRISKNDQPTNCRNAPDCNTFRMLSTRCIFSRYDFQKINKFLLNIYAAFLPFGT